LADSVGVGELADRALRCAFVNIDKPASFASFTDRVVGASTFSTVGISTRSTVVVCVGIETSRTFSDTAFGVDEETKFTGGTVVLRVADVTVGVIAGDTVSSGIFGETGVTIDRTLSILPYPGVSTDNTVVQVVEVAEVAVGVSAFDTLLLVRGDISTVTVIFTDPILFEESIYTFNTGVRVRADFAIAATRFALSVVFIDNDGVEGVSALIDTIEVFEEPSLSALQALAEVQVVTELTVGICTSVADASSFGPPEITSFFADAVLFDESFGTGDTVFVIGADIAVGDAIFTFLGHRVSEHFRTTIRYTRFFNCHTGSDSSEFLQQEFTLLTLNTFFLSGVANLTVFSEAFLTVFIDIHKSVVALADTLSFVESESVDTRLAGVHVLAGLTF